MPRTGKRQKKRDGKQHRAPLPLTHASPLEVFFSTYAPRFQYDKKVSASLGFYRLCREFGWGRDDQDKKTAHENFKDALVQQFHHFYGRNVDDLEAWKRLCHAVHIDPIPDGLHACREAVFYTFVNLVDLVDTNMTGENVETFPSERALSAYTISQGKFFPRDSPLMGSLLRYLLRHILNPRDGYDTTRRKGGFKYGRPRRR